jgi:hypothetical protein
MNMFLQKIRTGEVNSECDAGYGLDPIDWRLFEGVQMKDWKKKSLDGAY